MWRMVERPVTMRTALITSAVFTCRAQQQRTMKFHKGRE